MKKRIGAVLILICALALSFALVACTGGDKPKVDDECKHDYEVTATVAATCLQAGKETYTCKLCGDSYDKDIAALGHDMPNDWETVKQATCTENGKQTKKCKRCDYTEEKVLQMTAHAEYKEVAKQDSTCTDDGYITYKCVNCDDTYTEVLTKGHTPDGNEPAVSDPTCVDDGYTTYHCSVCGQDYYSDYLDALGHNWEATDDSVVASCDTEGYTVYECSRCHITNRVFEQGSARPAHSFTEGVCSVCGKDAFNAAPFIGGEDMGILRWGAANGNEYVVYDENPVTTVYVERNVLTELCNSGVRSFKLYIGSPDDAGRMVNYTVLGGTRVAFNVGEKGFGSYGEITFADDDGNLIESMFAGGDGDLQIEIQWGTFPGNEPQVEIKGYLLKLEYNIAFSVSDPSTWIDGGYDVTYNETTTFWQLDGAAGSLVTIDKKAVAMWIEDGNNVLKVDFWQKENQNTTFDIYLGGTVEGTRYNYNGSATADNLILSEYAETGIVFLVYYGNLNPALECNGFMLNCTPSYKKLFDATDPVTWIDGDFEISYDATTPAWQIDGGDGKNITISKNAVAMWIEQGYNAVTVDFYSKEGQATGFAAYIDAVTDTAHLYNANGICTVNKLKLSDYTESGIVFAMYLNNLNPALPCDGYMVKCTPSHEKFFDSADPVTWIDGDFEISYNAAAAAWQTDGSDGKNITINKNAVAMWIEQGYDTVTIEFYSKEGQATGFAAYIGAVIDADHLYNQNGVCTVSNLTLSDYTETGIVFAMYLNNLNPALTCDGYMVKCTPGVSA